MEFRYVFVDVHGWRHDAAYWYQMEWRSAMLNGGLPDSWSREYAEIPEQVPSLTCIPTI